MIAVVRHFLLPGKNAVLQPPRWDFPNKANHLRHTLCQVLKHGDKWPIESTRPCYYSQIEGLGLHVVYITRYVITIKKHLHNRIESNRKEYVDFHSKLDEEINT